MKKIIFALVFFGLAWTGFWYHGASKAKEIINKKITEAANYFEKEGYTLKTEDVFVKGFPFGFEAVIKSPHITKNEKATQSPNNLEAVLLDGYLSLTSNLIGTKFSVEKNGDSHIKVKNLENGLLKLNEFILSGDTSSTFSVEEPSYLEAIKNPFKALFKVIESEDNRLLVGKSGSFHAKDVKLINRENPSIVLFEVDKSDIEYEIKETDGSISFVKVDGDIKGLNLDTFLVGAEAYTPGHERSLKEIAFLLSIPKPGKMAINFETEITAPFKIFQDLGKLSSLNDLPPFNFNVKKVEVTNNFGNYFHKLNFSFQDLKDGIKQFHFNQLATAETSKAQYEFFRGQWEEFLNNLPICEGSVKPEEKANEGCLLVKALIPKIDEFGKIVAEIDLNIDIKNPEDLSDNSKILINHLNYFSAIYGLKSNGFFEFKKPEMLKSNYEINLLNYQSLFQDLFNYSVKIQKVLPIINPQAANLPKITEKHLKMITDYLKEISDEPTKDFKDITITIKINGPNDVIVGTLSQQQLVQKTQLMFFEFSKDFQMIETPKEEKMQVENKNELQKVEEKTEKEEGSK